MDVDENLTDQMEKMRIHRNGDIDNNEIISKNDDEAYNVKNTSLTTTAAAAATSILTNGAATTTTTYDRNVVKDYSSSFKKNEQRREEEGVSSYADEQLLADDGDGEDKNLDSDPDSAMFDADQHSEHNGTGAKPKKPNRYMRPDQKPVAVFTTQFDDLSFDKCSASQTYENFIKEAYSKVQRQVEQSRSLIEANIASQMGSSGGVTSTGASYLDYYSVAADEGRPIRTYGRYNDTTHTAPKHDDFGDRKSWARAKLTSEDSTTSDLSESGWADDASSSSNEDRAPARTWENSSLYGNRRYYSRFDQGRDPDYFDFDLNHSVDLFRKPKLTVAPRAPTYFEHQLFNDKSRMHGNTTISSLMFKSAEESEAKDGGCKTAMQTSFISSALRTPSYWEYRYQHMNGGPSAYKP